MEFVKTANVDSLLPVLLCCNRQILWGVWGVAFFDQYGRRCKVQTAPLQRCISGFFGPVIREQGAAFAILGRGESNLLESAYISLMGVEPIDGVNQNID